MISIYAKSVEGVWFGVALDGKKIFATNFGPNEKRVLQGLLNSIPFNVMFEHSEKASVFAEKAFGVLKSVYDGREVAHDFALATERLSAYTKRVIETALLVPVGYVTFYGGIARVAGGGPRAVGRVMALNPFAPIVPCHRVVGSDFSLRGYGGGLDVKLDLLRREKRGYTVKREISVKGKKLQVFPAEFVLEKVEER
jgi:O-6-methylguanine DNA methyltransferase